MAIDFPYLKSYANNLITFERFCMAGLIYVNKITYHHYFKDFTYRKLLGVFTSPDRAVDYLKRYWEALGLEDVAIEVELYPSEFPNCETYAHWIKCEPGMNWNKILREIKDGEVFCYEQENWREFDKYFKPPLNYFSGPSYGAQVQTGLKTLDKTNKVFCL
jgi:hypothetical protein